MLKKRVLGILCLMLVLVMALGSACAEAKFAWYFPSAAPYGQEVMGYAEQFVKDSGLDVRIMLGSKFDQTTQDTNLRALVADGYTYISSFPVGDGVAGTYEELMDFGAHIVGYGGATAEQTEEFCVATDTQAAAYAACDYVIDAMGGSGGILNVLENLSDTNTIKRKNGVEACIADHEGVELVQEVGDIQSIDQGVEKISTALTANIDKIDGIVCTGSKTSSAAAQVLADYYDRNPEAEKVWLVTIDTPEDVVKGIQEGYVYGTIAQNTFAHGYIPMMILQYMSEGYEKVEGEFFIDSGCVLVTQENLDSYSEDLQVVTDQIIADLTTKYLVKK